LTGAFWIDAQPSNTAPNPMTANAAERMVV
jgi:hypothetical protein